MYNRKAVKLVAKENLSNNFGVAFGTIFVGELIIGACAFTWVAPVILAGCISAGLAIVMLSIVRMNEVKFSDMFKGFDNFGTTCVSGVLIYVYLILWALLFVIPAIVKSYSYSMTFYILADNPGMKPNEAITKSRELMDGHKFDLFVLHLSFFWWYVLCAITLGLASIYVVPYVQTSTAQFYDTIKLEKYGCEET